MSTQNSNNIFNSVRGVYGLFGSTNKATKKLDEEENIDAPVIGEFDSTLTDEEIKQLTAKWVSEYDSYAKDIKGQQKDNVNYWIGKHYSELQMAGSKRPLTDNLIFEAIETFLPIATRGNPEAVVSSPDDQQNDLTKIVRNALAYQADRQNMRMKLKGVTRNWSLYMIGCAKVIYDTATQDMDTKVILPSRLILDPHAEIGPDGRYYGEYIGEKKRMTARKLSMMFPRHKAAIGAKCDNQWGTRLVYTEWWTRTDVFFTIDELVLGKFKNPHWNYDGDVSVVDPVTGETQTEEVRGRNHFAQPEFPYVFLSIFNIGRRPHDETSLVWQNIPLQDTINRRYLQIDRNVDNQNNGIVLSGKFFTKEQAAEAATQLSRGNPLWVPEGDIRAAYARDAAPQLAGDVFKHLLDARQELRNIFGTSGSNPEGIKGHESARGKILVNQLDSSRIGGGVSEYIEQVSATLFNWYVQMMYVYYTDEKAFPVLGTKQAQTFMSIRNTDFVSPLHITVKEGSMIPKDPLTERNEAMDLWSAGAIDPINLFTKLDFPNPRESAKELLTWQLIQKGALPPQAMFPDFQAPQVPTGADPTNAVSPQEGQRATPPDQAQPQLSPDIASRQLMGSVPIQ
jgi:hypothetical protein